MFKINAELEFVQDYSWKARKGTVANVDAVRCKLDSRSGVVFRVVGVWTKPQWFDASWFKGWDSSEEAIDS